MQGDLGGFFDGKKCLSYKAENTVYVCTYIFRCWFDGNNWWTTGAKHMKSMVTVGATGNMAQNSCKNIQNMKQGQRSKFWACEQYI